MPPQSWIKSPRRRQWVVTFAMVALLALSLGAAWAVSAAAREPMATLRIGAVELRAPASWNRVELPKSVDWLAEGIILEDRGETDRSMLVGLLPVQDEAISPREAAARVSERLLEPQSPEVLIPPTYHARPIQVGPIKGLVIEVVGRRSMRLQEHYLALLSQDQRQYTVVYLLADVQGEAMLHPDLAQANRLLFGAVLESVKDHAEPLP